MDASAAFDSANVRERVNCLLRRSAPDHLLHNV
jgi:hypothetical protein